MLSAEAQGMKDLLFSFKSSGAVSTVEDQRMALEALASFSPMPAGVQTEIVDMGGMRAEVIRAEAPKSELALLYLHGGSYSAGSITTHRSLVARICVTAGIHAYLPEYRLAPEHPFPAAVDDALAAYRHLLAKGVDPSKLIVAGDSAGGGLTLALMLQLKELELPLPLRIVLLSPWTDLTASGGSVVERAEVDPWLEAESLKPAARIYLGDADPANPLASPLFGDLTRLPSSLILVGADEILLDDSVRLNRALVEVGAPSRLHIAEGMWHVYPAFPGMPEADRAIDEIAGFLAEAAAS
ncbi:MAG: alpha/beta hydrolase [Actinomycetota bacterium]|nr:alpha/beta hydrolase [Actinomycetota bacterium]